MDYQKELTFLCNVLERSHIPTRLLDEENLLLQKETEDFLDEAFFLKGLFPLVLPKTLYKYSDPFERCYRLLLLPDKKKRTVLCIGPFLYREITAEQLLQISEQNSLSPQTHPYRYLAEYYAGLPVLSGEESHTVMLNVFCEKIWSTPAFAVEDIAKNASTDMPFTKSMRNLEPSDTLANKKAIEQRYAFENEMIRAVALGQPHMEERFHSAFANNFFEQRAADPLRNAKNYGVIMNTLLRKAAEQGGVHPLYLDQTSSDFAKRIENLSILSSISSLMKEMFLTYCRLVRTHTLRKYSPVVQKSILIIDADLSADLSPKLLAKSQDITLGYLSSVFKKETGQTLSEYILRRRIEYAEYLLTTTSLQVQTISLHCGIMDAQYFSKLFKKLKGKTPLQYRKSIHPI